MVTRIHGKGYNNIPWQQKTLSAGIVMIYKTKKYTGDKTRLYKNAGDLIRNLRAIKGISGKEFGYIVGLSQQQISRYETGRGRLTLGLLWRFADAFDLTFWELIDMLHHSFIQE